MVKWRTGGGRKTEIYLGVKPNEGEKTGADMLCQLE